MTRREVIRVLGAHTSLRVARQVSFVASRGSQEESTRRTQLGSTMPQDADLTEETSEAASWEGRALFDAQGERIGAIAGLAFRRPRFGTVWLLVEGAAKAVLVPAIQVAKRDGRLVLPYPRGYVEDAPAPEVGRRLTRAEERRLLLHYGLDSQLPDGGCPQRCGLCGTGKKSP